MITIHALASAGLNRLPDGEWLLHSRFSQAINFCRPDGELLTFFRYGKGMGPTGMLLSSRQFSRMTNIDRLIKRGNLLWGAGITLYPRRALQLRLRTAFATPVDLSSCSQYSGLFGPLNQPLYAMPHYLDINKQLKRWHRGMMPDWSWLIGYGPGLTPSGDDMLTGMLAVLHAAGFSSQLSSFLPPADRLVRLTTSVSCSYLNSARKGEFSTPVQQVIRSLQSGRHPQRAVDRLLAVGHTSGADTLLGIAIAQRWLQQVDSRRMNARSGNNSYFYSSCGDGEFFSCG
ncbi:DUF2877 domain-containing protein [Kluyvera sichuanensis]